MSAGISLAIARFGSSTPLTAQTGADNGGSIRESERIQREQESRRLQQLQQDRQSAAPPARIENPTPETQLSGSDTVCRDVGSITIDDADKLSPGTRRRVVAPYLGGCVTVEAIARLVGEVTKPYIDRGSATTRPYLPDQDRADRKRGGG